MTFVKSACAEKYRQGILLLFQHLPDVLKYRPVDGGGKSQQIRVFFLKRIPEGLREHGILLVFNGDPQKLRGDRPPVHQKPGYVLP